MGGLSVTNNGMTVKPFLESDKRCLMNTEQAALKIAEEAKRVENDTLYSAKGHYEAANYWANFHLLLGIPTAIISAIAGTSAFAQFNNHATIAGILAIIVTALTGITTFLNPNEKASAHQNVGNKYNAIRNRARALYNLDMLLVESQEELVQ